MKEKTLNRNFIFLIIGQASSMFGTALLKFTLSLLILDLTGSATLFGTITAIGYLPPIFLSPIGGIIADRCNKKKSYDCFRRPVWNYDCPISVFIIIFQYTHFDNCYHGGIVGCIFF